MIAEALDYYQENGLDPGYQAHYEARYCDAFTAFMGGGYADAVATGTASVFVAVATLGLEPGSQVLVSPITDPGTISAIILNGLVPRLVDSAPGSYNIGLAQVEARITETCKGLVAVHVAGQAIADIEDIVGICRERNIMVIEDCSQAHGAMVSGCKVGNFGNIAAFSTMYRKAHVTGASGGVVFTHDEDLHRKALAHADRGKPTWKEGFDDRNPDSFLFAALNLHTDEISCAIGLSSLARLPETIARRLKFVAAVSDRLKAESRTCVPYRWSDADSPFFYPIIVEAGSLCCSKTEFAKAVMAEGINLNPHYRYVVSDWPWIKRHLADGFDTPNAHSIRDRTFCLYLNENYGNREVDDILAAILKVEAHLRV